MKIDYYIFIGLIGRHRFQLTLSMGPQFDRSTGWQVNRSTGWQLDMLTKAIYAPICENRA